MKYAQIWTVMFVGWMALSPTAWGQTNPGDPNCSPANLLLVVDTSGSMSTAGKLDGLKKAAADVINAFKTKLRMGLIRFSRGQAQLLVPLGPAYAKTPDTEGQAKKLLAALQGLQADGDTPMTKALELALNTYKKEIPSDPLHQDPDPNTKRRNFVLLVTDGEPTDATTTYNPLIFIKKLRKLAVGPKTYEILTVVVGLGAGNQIRPYELKQYALAGGTQNFLHALKAADLAPFFKKVSKTASTETCNGRDDNCDGTTDEDLKRKCKNNCGEGIEICHKGKWSKCDAPPPLDEKCDGRDNNCNGQVDEGLERDCSSQCGTGKQSCIQGDWSTCTAPRPEPEKCDGVDNDCDGQIDNGSPCPGGKCVVKVVGQKRQPVCEIRCSKDGECPGGYICERKSWICNPKPCQRKKCPAGTICDDKTGKAVCIDPCTGVTCPAGKTCGESGTCIDCYQDKCAPGKTCRGGKCIKDPCFSSVCPKGQACRDGRCFDVCEGVQCAPGESCSEGRCKKDPCVQKTCPKGQACVQGQCVHDKCQDITSIDCGTKRICNVLNGACEDAPCARTICPTGQSCFRGECGLKPPKIRGEPNSFCLKDDDCKASAGQVSYCKNQRCSKPEVLGCGGGCSVGGAEAQYGAWTDPMMWMFGLWLVLFVVRRRRC